MRLRNYDNLTIKDFKKYPVWEFTHTTTGGDEMDVAPIKQVPVSSAENRVFGTEVKLKSGKNCWAVIGGIAPNDPSSTREFMSCRFWHKSRWFPLARPFDVAYDSYGPASLAQFLGMNLDAVFPITYDLRSLIIGNQDALLGVISAEAKSRLSTRQLVQRVMKTLKI